MLYGYETWTLLTEQEQQIWAFQIKCFMRLLWISHREQKNNFVCSLVIGLVGPWSLLATVNQQKFWVVWSCHPTWHFAEDGFSESHWRQSLPWQREERLTWRSGQGNHHQNSLWLLHKSCLDASLGWTELMFLVLYILLYLLQPLS